MGQFSVTVLAVAGSNLSGNQQVAHWLPDASCLVEPEPGLWLLMIDATVFEPRDGILDPMRKRAFLDPSDAGWSAVLRVKPFLLDWIADVMARGRAAGKLVLPVSHYPVLPPLPGLQTLLPGAALTRRSPVPAVADRLAAAGLRLHVGGHLHLQGLTVQTAPQAVLTDILLPSTCAFPPAAMLIEGDATALRLRALSLGDLVPDPAVAAMLRVEGAPDHADFGSALCARYHERLLTRRLPREMPPAIWMAVQGHRLRDLPALLGGAGPANQPDLPLPDLPLSDLVVVTVMLAEGGALALPHVPPDDRGVWRAVARLTGTNDDPLARWLSDLLRLLDQVLRAAETDPGDVVLRV